MTYKPYQVPKHIADAAEKEAKKRRRKKGEDIKWSEVIREILEKWLKAIR